MPEVEVVFGELRQTVAVDFDRPELHIHGFVPTNLSIPLESMVPITVPDGFMRAVALSMSERFLDAVVFGERDVLIRARSLPTVSGSSPQIVLFLCVPKKAIFDAKVQEFNYPDFTLVL